jgi:exodeoxyribonuclease-3
MNITIASWNINSVRLRTPHIAAFLAHTRPDVLCLQETKTEDATFPYDFFRTQGYIHQLHLGQKSYNGVAVLSHLPLQAHPLTLTTAGASRHIAAIVNDDILLHNFYVPAGGDIPDPALNPKFADKLAFLAQMQAWASAQPHHRTVMVGDFNIAPHPHDVWSHTQLVNVVSHTPLEVETLLAIQHAGGFVDSARHFIAMEEKAYSWWSYRNRDWQKSNRGRRLDHIWVSSDLKAHLHAYHSFPDMRNGEKPSDHVPIMVDLAL